MCAYNLFYFLNEAYYKGEYHVKKRNLRNDFLFCCDVLGLTYHLDFTRNEPWACLGYKFRISHINRNLTLYFLRCETHNTYKCVEEKDISPWTPLIIIWLIMTFIAPILTYKDLSDLNSSILCALENKCLSNFECGLWSSFE